MEYLSPNQLESYDTILEELNNEYKKKEQIQSEIAQEYDRIITLKLKNIKQKLNVINIKVFSSLLELYNLYGNELNVREIMKLPNLESYKFYLIETYLPNVLLERLVKNCWHLQLSLITPFNNNVNKIVKLGKQNPIFEILVVDNKIQSCEFRASLFTNQNSFYNVIKLERLVIDISYHFQSGRDKNFVNNNYNLYQIAKLYSNESLNSKSIKLQCKMPCKVPQSELVSLIIENSYHNFNVESLVKFRENREIVDIELFIDNRRVVINYNEGAKMLKIQADSGDITNLKKLFLKCACYDYVKAKANFEELEIEYGLNGASSVHQLKKLNRIWL